VMCPLGAFLCYFGFERVASGNIFLGCALGVSAGVFLCIALGDILPEVRFHSHDRLWLSLALIFGVVVAVLVGWLEPNHADHEHGWQWLVNRSSVHL